MKTIKQNSEQRRAEAADAREFQQIQKFVAECRRHWPGAVIVLRPEGAAIGASAPIQPEPVHQETTMASFNDYNDTPTEADVDTCYGSKYLSSSEVGNRRIKTTIEGVRKELLQQQGGTAKPRLILALKNLDKEMVLNTTNLNALVEALGKGPSGWIGAEVGIYTEATTYAGKPTRGLRLRVLNKPAATPAPKPVPPRPAPRPAAAEQTPWPDQPDDPGPDFIDAAE